MSEFVPYEYAPQFSEGSAQVGASTQPGSGEGAGWSRGPFSYVTGDTSSGLQHVGWIDKDGEDIYGIVAPTAKLHFAVLEKFLVIPGDGTLGPMQLTIIQNAPAGSPASVEGPFPFRFVDDNAVAAAFSISVVQVDRTNKRRSPTRTGQTILYGPEKFTQCNHSVTNIRPVDTAKPGIPVYLRVVCVMTSTLVSWTADDANIMRPVYADIPATDRFTILYSIPVSVSRVAR